MNILVHNLVEKVEKEQNYCNIQYSIGSDFHNSTVVTYKPITFFPQNLYNVCTMSPKLRDKKRFAIQQCIDSIYCLYTLVALAYAIN